MNSRSLNASFGSVEFPFVKSRIVIVNGPAAAGVYDLNCGVFRRINTLAATVLRGLTGTIKFSELAVDHRDFIKEADTLGFIAWQDSPVIQPQTRLEDVIQALRPVRFAWIEITSKCNQLCKHCFLGSDLNAFPQYSLHEIGAMLETLQAAGARQIIFSGGEPLSHPHITEILELAGSEYPFKLSLLSNGSHPRLLKITDLLLKHEVTVKIPLLGWGANHDEMAGLKNGFEKTITSITALRQAGVDVTLGTTVTSLNRSDIPSIRQFANENNISLEVSPLYSIGYAVANHDELYRETTQDEIVAVCVDDKKHIPLTQIHIRRPSQTGRYQVESTDYDAVNLRDYLTAHSECGQKIIAILSSREVTPCLLLRDKQHSLGSLNQYSLQEILAHDTREAKVFDDLMRLANIPGCGVCEARFVCKAGGCPASAQAFAGSFTAKNPLYNDCYYINPALFADTALLGR